MSSKQNTSNISTNEEYGSEIDQGLLNELADALDIDDIEDRKRLVASVGKFISTPVPPPKVLEGYDKYVEGGAKWLLQYTKDEQQHRHKMNRRELNYYSAGQVMGFLLGLSGVGGGIFLAGSGVEWFGFGIFFTSVVSLVSLFVYNKKHETNEEKSS